MRGIERRFSQLKTLKNSITVIGITWGNIPPVVLFLLETGMRASEFLALRNDNIDLERGIIGVRETQAIRFKDSNKDSKGVEF